VILVTVGTQFFDELIAEVDRLAGAGVVRDDVYAQIGLCATPPKHLDWVKFDRKLHDKMCEADLIITHAGTGCVIEAIELGKPFIAVVNGGKAGDHQREFLSVLETTHDFCWIESPDLLESALGKARPATAHRSGSIDRLCADLQIEMETAGRSRRVRR
jgi:UDP-N-acetylglucosamine transferase subunit ALG13